MSSKNTKNNKTIKKDEKVSSVIEVKEKDSKLSYVLIIIILVLSSLLIYSFFFNNKKEECESKCSAPVVEIEVDPKYQLINYEGFRFKMPLNWDFVSDKNEYNIADKEETLFITLGYVDKDYDSFASNEYQSIFLENIQTSDNIKVEPKKMDNYYLYEGSYNNYNYMIVAIGNDKKTVLVKAQFIDKVTFDKLKNDVIDFSLTGITKSDS